jgi:hypothetical protein
MLSVSRVSAVLLSVVDGQGQRRAPAARGAVVEAFSRTEGQTMNMRPGFSSQVVGFLPHATDDQLATLLSHLSAELHHRGVETSMTLDALACVFSIWARSSAPRKEIGLR